MASIFNIDTLIISFDILDYDQVIKKCIALLDAAKEKSRKHLYANLDTKEYVTIKDERLPDFTWGQAFITYKKGV